MKLIQHKKLIEEGIKVGDSKMFEQDKIWSRYSRDKVDIGEELAKVIRVLDKALPLARLMRALSVGSSDEPQFRILETAFRGGLYLLDIDNSALDIVRERLRRQHTGHVSCICTDYKKIFNDAQKTRDFLRERLAAGRLDLVTLHHSMYYCRECDWEAIIENLFKFILARQGAIHAVLMASKSDNEYSTTWLYNHFAGKFCGCINDQDLKEFKKSLSMNPVFKGAQVFLKTHAVSFFVDDFAKFMSVAWMILLYPDVHKYTLKQREEIAEFVYRRFWLKKQPLVQLQDHLIIYKGIRFRGLI